MTARLPAEVAAILQRLEDAGFEAYAVGGAVRDMLRGVAPHDWDICSSALPEQVRGVFSGSRVADTGIKHGTVSVLSGGSAFEVTTFRTDGGYSDSRRPDSVVFTGSLEGDLARRDFTVNAMAFSEKRGLVDIFGGREDLRAGLIRCVGEPSARFGEDALRILRALRFASALGFEIEEKTAAALVEKREFLNKISAERIFSELTGILRGSGAGELLARFSSVFAVVLPECAAALTPEGARAVGSAPCDEIVRLALLCILSGADAEALLRRLKSDNRTREGVADLVRLAGNAAPAGRFEVRRLLSETDAETAARYLEIRRALGDSGAEAASKLLRDVLANEGRITLKELDISGGELMALGVPPGRAVGEELQRLLLLVLAGEAENKNAELREKAKGG